VLLLGGKVGVMSQFFGLGGAAKMTVGGAPMRLLWGNGYGQATSLWKEV